MRAWKVFRAVAESHKGLDRVGRDARARRLLKAWDQEMDLFCIWAAETIELSEARVQLLQV